MYEKFLLWHFIYIHEDQYMMIIWRTLLRHHSFKTIYKVIKVILEAFLSRNSLHIFEKSKLSRNVQRRMSNSFKDNRKSMSAEATGKKIITNTSHTNLLKKYEN